VRRVGAEKIAILALVLATSGCTWVSVTEEGEHVRVVRSSEVGGCEKLGNVSAKTTDRVIIFARSDRKVREELRALARNEATELGGNAIVPLGAPDEGRQSFDVYRCQQR
jgi:hypothetical protein